MIQWWRIILIDLPTWPVGVNHTIRVFIVYSIHRDIDPTTVHIATVKLFTFRAGFRVAPQPFLRGIRVPDANCSCTLAFSRRCLCTRNGRGRFRRSLSPRIWTVCLSCLHNKRRQWYNTFFLPRIFVILELLLYLISRLHFFSLTIACVYVSQNRLTSVNTRHELRRWNKIVFNYYMCYYFTVSRMSTDFGVIN